MTTEIAAVVLAAGLGTRLRPLTALRPKPLCPVNNVALVDHAIGRARAVTDAIAVNAHSHADQMRAHLGSSVHLSVEQGSPLGTAGAIGNLLGWIAGRAVLVVNADSWHDQDLLVLTKGWDGERIRLMVVYDEARPDFGAGRYAGAALMPFAAVAGLRAVFSGLHDAVWVPWLAAERVEFVRSDAPFFDCGTPSEYHAANMHVSGGRTVVGEGARVLGSAEECVLWPGVTVRANERLVRAIRARDDVTIVI